MVLLSLTSWGQENVSRISGRVTDSTGVPLAGANVTVENTKIGAVTDRNGNYSLSDLQNGIYNFHFSFLGYEPVTLTAGITGDTVLDAVIRQKSFMTEEVFVNATRAGVNTPIAYSNIAKESIDRAYAARDVPYLLDNTPSLVVSSDAGGGVGYTYINIRGSDVSRINVTIDGIPVNDAESHGVWWVDMPDLASSTDNIQVQRGVGTSTNGAGAFGATINFQTGTPGHEPYSEVNTSYGSFNTSRNTLSLGTGLLNNKFSFDARLSKIWSDGYIDRAFSDLKSFYVAGTMYGRSSILKLIIFSGVEHTYQAWLGVPKDSLGTHRTFNPYNYKNETDNYWQDNYQLHYSKELNPDLTLNAALHYTHGKGYYENLVKDATFSSYNLPPAIFGTDTISTSDLVTQRWLRNDFYGFIYSLNYKNERLNAILGGGWNQYLGNHFGDIIWAKIATFDNETYRWYNGTGDKKDLNTYFKFNYLLTDRLNLFADLQLRNIYYFIGGHDEYLKDVTQRHIYNFFNPKAGLIYNLNEKQKLFASFGISQREPVRSNFTDAEPQQMPYPEKLYDYEGGYEYSTHGFMIKGNLYYMQYRDQLILTGKINNVGSAIMTNVPESFRQGIELETAIKVSGKLNWSANLSLSRNKIPVFTDYTDDWDTGVQAEQVLKNKTISFSPSAVASSTFDCNIFNGFRIGLNTKIVGKQYIDNTESNERALDSYLVNNLSLAYSNKSRLFREFKILFMINNLFNSMYETNAWIYKYFAEGSLHVLDGYFPQAGTNWMFRISFKF